MDLYYTFPRKMVVKDGSDPSSFDYQSKALATELHDHNGAFSFRAPDAVTFNEFPLSN